MRDHTSAVDPSGPSGRQYHVGVAPGEVAPSILLVGDPARAERVAATFDTVRLERRNREFVTFTGAHRDLPVTVVGTGMGAPNTEIAVVELGRCVSRPVLVRCGSCGALQPELRLGDLVISSGALRLENTSSQLVDPGYPALADPEVVIALVEAVDRAGLSVHVGITATAPGFYAAQGRAGLGGRVPDPDPIERLARQAVLNLEMETSCLLTLATLAGLRAGAVCAVYASRAEDTFVDDDQRAAAERACTAAGLEALHVLARMDAQRGARPRWHPGLAGGDA
jgi:uridine phosphorylase